MRNLPAALAISVIAHGAVIGWWVAHRPAPQPRVVESPAIDVEIVPVPLTPTARVAPPPLQPPPPPPDRQPPATPGMARIAASTAPAPRIGEPAPEPITVAPPPAPPTAPSSSLLSMRDSRPNLEVPDSSLESIAARQHAPEQPAQEQPPPGARTIDDIDHEIAETQHHLHDSDWVANATPEAVGDARRRLQSLQAERDGHELQRNPDGTYTAAHSGYTVTVDRDGTTHVSDQRNWQQHGLNGSFDATDALMRHYGQDPYAANKLETLDRTRDERAEITKRYRREQLSHSKELVTAALVDVWKTTRDLPGRKQLVFELWDDCAESGDAAIVEGGRQARAAVVTFIQAHFTGPDAYTPAELRALNAHKSSKEPFAPYERD